MTPPRRRKTNITLGQHPNSVPGSMRPTVRQGIRRHPRGLHYRPPQERRAA